jgi:hypothetical protein
VATRIRSVGFWLVMGLVLLAAIPVWAANSVVVESKSVQGGSQDVQIGIYLTNDLPLRNLVIPLVLRSVAGGAFVTKVAVKRTASARIDDYLTGINLYEGFLKDTSQGCYTYVTIPGTPPRQDTTFSQGFDRTPSWVDTSSHSVVGPPVATIISCGRLLPSEPTLPAGSDTAPSFHLLADIDNFAGEFIVDTVCIGPSNHLVFVADSASVAVGRKPSFTEGVITVTPTSVQYLGGDGIPRDYDLDQNYPNPFNASTVIKFNTKHDGHVRLDVYNILGQKVRTLVDEFRNFGPQAADWDGTDVVGKAVPTGLYFYRLVTSDFTDVKKMVLLK